MGWAQLMAVISSDFHGNTAKLHRFLEYKPDELHIFAGDAVDSWDEPKENQLKVLTTLIESSCILIYGNHELSYHRTKHMQCSGWHKFGGEHFSPLLDDDRWLAAYAVDDYLITHAGLSECQATKARSAKTAAKYLNDTFKASYRKLFDVGYARGGNRASGGVFWFDYRYDYVPLSKRYNQVFGHSAGREPWEDRTDTYHHVCVNSDDRLDKVFIFDTELKRIVIL